MTEVRGLKSYSLEWVALDKHVLLVKVSSEGQDNGVYIGAVERKDYDVEALGVVVNGSAVWWQLAGVYFEPPWSFEKPVKWLLQAQPFHDKEWFDKHRKLVKPEGIERPTEWTPNILELHPLDKHVLAVAAGHPPDTWGAYIGAVKGEGFDREAQGVVESGSEIPFELAEVLFEDLGKSTRAGDMKWHHDPQPRPIELDPDILARIRAGVRRQKEKGQSWNRPSPSEKPSSPTS